MSAYKTSIFLLNFTAICLVFYVKESENSKKLALNLLPREHPQDNQIYLLNQGWYKNESRTCLLSFELHLDCILKDDVAHIRLNIPSPAKSQPRRLYLANSSGKEKEFRKLKLSWVDGEEDIVKAAITKPLIKKLRKVQRRNKTFSHLRFEFDCDEEDSEAFLQEAFMEIKSRRRQRTLHESKVQEKKIERVANVKKKEIVLKECQMRYAVVHFNEHLSIPTVPANLKRKLWYCSGECKQNSNEEGNGYEKLSKKCCVPTGFKPLYYLTLVERRIQKRILFKANVTGCQCI